MMPLLFPSAVVKEIFVLIQYKIAPQAPISTIHIDVCNLLPFYNTQ